MNLESLKITSVLILIQICSKNVLAQLPNFTLPPGMTLPPGINIPDLPDNYMLIHQALIRDKGNTNLNQHLCGGALVLNFTIITAASCLLKDNGEFYSASELSVALGFYSLQNNGLVQPTSFDVREVIIHGRYIRRTRGNNIAMIKLSSTVEAGDTITPTMPSSEKMSSTMDCYLLGYHNGASTVTKIKPQYRSTCKSETTLETFCSDESDSASDVCLTRQGSALICDGLLQGIVTRSCSEDEILQYLDASHFFFWTAVNQFDENPYRLADIKQLRYFLFGSLDFIAWAIGTPQIADKFELVKFFF